VVLAADTGLSKLSCSIVEWCVSTPHSSGSDRFTRLSVEPAAADISLKASTASLVRLPTASESPPLERGEVRSRRVREKADNSDQQLSLGSRLLQLASRGH